MTHEIKSEDEDTALWQEYSIHPPPIHLPAYDANYCAPPVLPISCHGPAQKETYRSLDLPSNDRHIPPRDGSGILTASPPSFCTHHSYPSLKRSYHDIEDSPYSIVQSFRDDPQEAHNPSINHDHRLLSFGQLPETSTILDAQGRVQSVDLVAQIHGMFFLSELATTSGESLMMQPELTCYRRNLFQIFGSVTVPRGALSALTGNGERVPIVSKEVVISATESVDGHVVKLIVIPWKTPPPNFPKMTAGQEHEPVPISLTPFDEGPEAHSDYTVFPIAYRRLQFRIATANNGRRRELQQHFSLHLNVVGTLSNGRKMSLCEASTAPIVVRGRSPRNFQARKEIPLVGSSSARGQPPEMYVAAPGGLKPSISGIDSNLKLAKPLKSHMAEFSRSPFTFNSNSIPGSPSMVRQPTYQAWSAAHTSTPADHTSALNTLGYASAPRDSYLQANHHTLNSISELQSHKPPLASQPLMRQPYSSYHPPSTGVEPLRFVHNDSDLRRPTKSPRHTGPADLHSSSGILIPSSSSYANHGSRFLPAYSSSSYGSMPATMAPEQFPSLLPMQQQPSGTSGGPGTETGTIGGTGSPSQIQGRGAQQQHHEIPGEQQQAVWEGKRWSCG
ncbi:uncharacterized protein L3040_008458 [Drepanopeziza brunnea f. sp. 'multigermtubi']|uniref:uncharacterized protein n=1 Tax=Drepanopeziza brunnea f. sp. 'multigermtubi' TaxID=698441 RepID=UPI002396383C|nr:hypothetical protein L3040_008458 [Drepanopeziza brunnea f. sp. 'multigermtubi']